MLVRSFRAIIPTHDTRPEFAPEPCGKHFRNGHSTLHLGANGLGRITTSNVRAANGAAGSGGFGLILWVAPNDYAKAAQALGV